MLDIGYAAALVGGVLALLSPCSALLLPSFFAYAFAGPRRLVARTGVFLVGLLVVLVPLGAGSGGLASVVNGHRGVLITIAGWLLIVLGVVQAFGRGWTVGPAARWAGALGARTTAARGAWVATAGLGAAYGLAGFCSGPILGAVLTVAAAGGSAGRGAALLAVYAVGMTVPLFVLAALWQRFDLANRRWLRGRELHVGRWHGHTTSLAGGLLFVAVGVLFLVSDGTAGLVGADPETALAAESAAAALGRHIPDIALLAAAVVIVIALALWRLRRERERDGHRRGEH